MTGRDLRNYRTARGMLQREYADALGVHRQTITGNERNPDAELTRSLADKVRCYELDRLRDDATRTAEQQAEIHDRIIALSKDH